MTKFERADAERMLVEVFAPWVQALGLSVEAIEPDGAVLRMRFSRDLCRDNGVVCGQALMSLADTAMAFAVSAAAGAYRPMTTVDQTIHLLRPAVNADILADARVLRLGKTMAFGRVTLLAEGDPRPVGTAQVAYALMGGSTPPNQAPSPAGTSAGPPG
jgi:uncharacterized protein (TIGR00369 family)